MKSALSGYGLASLVAASVGGVATLLLAIGMTVRRSLASSDPASSIAIDLLLIAFVLLNALALALGIAGIVQPGRSKKHSVPGTVCSSITLIAGFCAAMLGTFDAR